ncbi:YicC/YloC family endoribonuclease [Peptoniphilus sp.]|jgi:uncharacterized protein (TIGR00255 family)|uniref:YicC/YloC family endoribonuclease n=1 Tax=Peptoniphilus sp. TaxID=1971214 RepID=UPI003D8AE06C
MKSMTGYGLSEFKDENYHIKVEIKSVNNRFLDINTRLPRFLLFAEEEIKSLLKQKLNRGKVDVFINFEFLNSDNVDLEIDYTLAKKYYEAGLIMGSKYDIENDITTSKILSMPDVVNISDAEIDPDVIKAYLLQTTEEAVNGLIGMREVEGSKLKEDFEVKLSNINSLVQKIQKRAPITLKENEVKLRDRIDKYLEESEVEEARILTEIAILLDKLSIDEEITRLFIHVKSFNDIINSNGAVGRKLDFLLQEFNREANTIGSKSNDIETLNLVVELKSEIEKLREQVQNVE